MSSRGTGDSSEDIFIGVDGGSTKTKILLMKGNGQVIADQTGQASNQWQIGMKASFKIIHDMVTSAMSNAGIEGPIKSIAMCMSGADGIKVQIKMMHKFRKLYSRDLYKNCFVYNDTRAPIAASSDKGGMVVIAGTGSNCAYWNGTQLVGDNCGGWGHMMGDEGSAYWIAHYCVKYFFDSDDGFTSGDEELMNIDFVRNATYTHFSVCTKTDLLEHIYSKFNKAKFAALCKIFSEGAQKGDPLCCRAFHEAGRMLCRHIKAVMRDKIQDTLSVVCIGSVWKSFALLREGFIEELNASNMKIKRLNLVKLWVDCTYGAAYIASQQVHQPIPVNYDNNVRMFFSYDLDNNEIITLK